MGRFVTREWTPDLNADGPRRARVGGVFRAWVPEYLVGRTFAIDARIAADVSDAERAMMDLDAGVLRQVGGRIRYRLYEADGVFDLVTEAERALASPTGDTRRDPPVRAAPARPGRRRRE